MHVRYVKSRRHFRNLEFHLNFQSGSIIVPKKKGCSHWAGKADPACRPIGGLHGIAYAGVNV